MKNIIKRLHVKRIILIFVIVLWMCVVFYLSDQNGDKSSGTSSQVINIVVSIFTKVTNIELTNQSIYNLTFVIRKIAHLTLYFIGVIPIFSLFKTYNINRKRMYIYALLFCTMYACSDELHQIFTQGRDGNAIDILIDTMGSVFGIIFVDKVSNIIYISKR